MATHAAPNQPSGSLFISAGQGGAPPGRPEVARSRAVKINQSLLLDTQGAARQLPPNTEITLNIFPDTSYTPVIDQVEQEGDSYTWVGHLQGVDPSSVMIVYTAGVFMGHFASPQGIYEVSSAGDDLYQLIQIDQNKLPGGEGDVTLGA